MTDEIKLKLEDDLEKASTLLLSDNDNEKESL